MLDLTKDHLNFKQKKNYNHKVTIYAFDGI